MEQIKKEEFNEKIKEGKVLIDCYADWCGPCRMLGPILEEVSNEVESYNFYKLNVDDSDEIVRRYKPLGINYKSLLYYKYCFKKFRFKKEKQLLWQ